MTPAEESMFRFQLSVIISAVINDQNKNISPAVEQLIEDVNKMLAKREVVAQVREGE
jgi:hypothetical protein